MARKKKSKPAAVKKPANPERARALRIVTIKTLISLILVAASAAGYLKLRRMVWSDYAYSPQPPQVVLLNQPVWMSDYLAARIIQSIRPPVGHSAMDHRMLEDCALQLGLNPWVREVRQVRRVYRNAPGDTLEVDCEYRAPIALVRYDDYYILVDNDATVLPEVFRPDEVSRLVFGHDGRMNIRVIEGVSRQPPVPGHRWPGDDLQAGLWMVKMLHDKPYAEEIVRVDVSNYGGRELPNQAHIVLHTRYDTEVRWGQAPSWRGFEAPVQTKLANLQHVYERYGRIDANQAWIDLRLDEVLRPSDGASAAATLER